jgi:hypothetical protein
MMRRLASRLRIALAASALALGLTTACYTPSVPLPPPLVENMTFAAGTAAGTFTLSSPAEAQVGGALFTVYNASRQMGVIFQSAADGSFTSPELVGVDGDYIKVSYEKNEGSVPRCTTLHFTGTPIGGNASDCH